MFGESVHSVGSSVLWHLEYMNLKRESKQSYFHQQHPLQCADGDSHMFSFKKVLIYGIICFDDSN